MRHLPSVDGLPALAYLTGLTISHFVSLMVVVGIILYGIVAVILPRLGVMRAWGALVATLLLGLLTLDTFVYDLYRYHVNSFTLELLFGGAGSQIFQFQFRDYVLIFSVLAAGFVGEWFLFGLTERLLSRRWLRGGGWITVVIASLLFLSHMTHAWASAACYRPITKVSRCYPLNLPTTANSLFYKLGWASPDKNQAALNDAPTEATTGNLRYPLTPILADTSGALNVLLILLDSWNHTAMDSVMTPNIARFAKQACYFRNHYSGANGTRTGVFSLFYSLPGTYWYDVLASKVRPILIDQFLRCRYDFEVFTSASLVSPPFDQTIFAGVQGIDLHVAGDWAHTRDIQITKDWLAFTQQRKATSGEQPYFGFLFYDALHSISHPREFKGPFQPAWTSVHYEQLSDDMDPTLFWNLYRNVAVFEDSLVGSVLADLERNGQLEKTIVIITGDHGQEFNENKKGYWGHGGNYSQAQVGVPLIIRWPGMSPATYDHWTSHYDLVPLLMQRLFHCRNQISDYSIGRDIFDTTGRDWLLVGSDDDFGVIEPDRITSIHYDRSFDITDRNLNELDGASMHTELITRVLKAINAFYLK